MANARGKTVDTTYLSVDNAEERGFIHRDYLAHCLRWTHAVRHITKILKKGPKILDVGCGRELPLAKMLYSSRLIPDMYVGIDAGPVTIPDMFHTGKFPIKVVSNADFANRDQVAIATKFDVIVSFEVMEHVEPDHTVRLLARIREALADDGVAFISTPCYDPATGAAANHVNEMTYSAFGSVIERVGFGIEAMYGTFASIRDYQHLMPEPQRAIFDKMREYYDVNVLSCIFAPLYPQASRNCLWRLTKKQDVRRFPLLQYVPTPWSSSAERERDLLTAQEDWTLLEPSYPVGAPIENLKSEMEIIENAEPEVVS